MLTKYCPKRQHFSYNGMQARTELAIIDHNNNVKREQATTANGIYMQEHVYVYEVYMYAFLCVQVL